jgi:hypothetical protein
MVAGSLRPCVLDGWESRDAWAERGDAMAAEHLTERLEALWRPSLPDGLATAESLLTDVLLLADQHSDADLMAFREQFRARKTPIDG